VLINAGHSGSSQGSIDRGKLHVIDLRAFVEIAPTAPARPLALAPPNAPPPLDPWANYPVMPKCCVRHAAPEPAPDTATTSTSEVVS